MFAETYTSRQWGGGGESHQNNKKKKPVGEVQQNFGSRSAETIFIHWRLTTVKKTKWRYTRQLSRSSHHVCFSFLFGKGVKRKKKVMYRGDVDNAQDTSHKGKRKRRPSEADGSPPPRGVSSVSLMCVGPSMMVVGFSCHQLKACSPSWRRRDTPYR
jgi:hypothetical protein